MFSAKGTYPAARAVKANPKSKVVRLDDLEFADVLEALNLRIDTTRKNGERAELQGYPSIAARAGRKVDRLIALQAKLEKAWR